MKRAGAGEGAARVRSESAKGDMRAVRAWTKSARDGGWETKIDVCDRDGARVLRGSLSDGRDSARSSKSDIV